MTPALALDLLRNAILVALTVAAPLLATALLVGILVSLIQAVTQIQEQTLTFIPKLLAMAAVFLVMLPWSVARLVDFLVTLLRSLPTMVS
jgi:flagellar biosynthesis protein FliQ